MHDGFNSLMRPFAPLLLATVLFCTASFAAPPTTEEAFANAVREAFEAKSLKKIHALTWEKGASAQDLEQMATAMKQIFKTAPAIETVTVLPLPANYLQYNAAFGYRYEPTYPPTGIIRIDYAPNGPKHLTNSLGYAIIDDGYYLVTGKTIDLKWKGPVDKPYHIVVEGTGKDKVSLRVKYNASGVDLEQFVGTQVFPAQYISEATLTSTDPDAAVTFKIMNGDKVVYQSELLEGKGSLHYQRKPTK